MNQAKEDTSQVLELHKGKGKTGLRLSPRMTDQGLPVTFLAMDMIGPDLESGAR